MGIGRPRAKRGRTCTAPSPPLPTGPLARGWRGLSWARLVRIGSVPRTDSPEYRLSSPEYRAMMEKLKQARQDAGLNSSPPQPCGAESNRRPAQVAAGPGEPGGAGRRERARRSAHRERSVRCCPAGSPLTRRAGRRWSASLPADRTYTGGSTRSRCLFHCTIRSRKGSSLSSP